MLLRTWKQWRASICATERCIRSAQNCRSYKEQHKSVTSRSERVDNVQRMLSSHVDERNRTYTLDLYAVPESCERSEEAYLDRLRSNINERNLLHVTRQIIEEIRSDPACLTEKVSTALIEVLCSLKMTHEAIEFLKYSRDRGTRPRIHAYSGAIAATYDQAQYILALRVFEVMRDDGYVPKEITYARALSAAHKLMHHDLVHEIYEDIVQNDGIVNTVIINKVLRSCSRVGDEELALKVYRCIREREIPMTSSTCHSLAIIGGKTGNWELATDAYKCLIALGLKSTVTICKSTISACTKARKWQQAVDIFEAMEPKLQDEIVDAYLGKVLMAYANASKDDGDSLKLLDLYHKRQARGETLNTYAHNAVLRAYTALGQLKAFFDHAKQMQQNGIQWDVYTHKLIVIAHIRDNSVQKALKLLRHHEHQVGYLADCYRELIQYYGEKRNNHREACRYSNKLMQNNRLLQPSDWEIALHHSLQIYDTEPKFYWNFRRWMQSRWRTSLQDIPSKLLLPEPKSPNDIGYHAYMKNLAPAQVLASSFVHKDRESEISADTEVASLETSDAVDDR